MNLRPLALVLCLLLLATGAAAADKPWVEVRSPHFRVLTNGSLGDGRHVAHEFEEMRYVFAARFPTFRLESGAPLLIFAPRDEDTARSLEPRLWRAKGPRPAGAFHHGWEKQYVMVRLDTWGPGAHEVVYHEYTHFILHTNAHWLPIWLDEGVAEFYAYTRFRQRQIYVGAPSERYRILANRAPIPVEALISADQRSPYLRDEDQAQMFYAESWALVHFMTFGPGMESGDRLNRFFAMLQQGTEQKKAFQEAFGSFKDFDKSLGDYVRRVAFPVGVLKDPPQIEEKEFAARTLSLAETEAELAGFHLWTHDRAGARPLVEQALKNDPKLGSAHEEMGFLLFAEGKDGEAKNEFSQAYALDGTLYLSLFAKTMLSPIASSDAPADQAAFRESLLKVLDLDPQFAPAYVELARLKLRQNDPKTALGLSRKAEQLEPWLAGYHLLSGRILLRLGNKAEAAAFARFVAERWFGPDHDEAVELWNSVPPEARPALEQPISEAAIKDTESVEGRLKSVTCGEHEQQWTLVLDRGGRSLTFRQNGVLVVGFSDTIWYGEDHFSLCHHLEGMRAVVRYRPASDASYAGDIAEIAIRDDLPGSAGN